MADNRCVVCGEIIPEGRQVCPLCEKKTDRKYWLRVTEIQNKQTLKGLKSYGQILEENTSMTVLDRLEAIEEELVDALMYLEHLKEIVKGGSK